jgi:hypothetical protein
MQDNLVFSAELAGVKNGFVSISHGAIAGHAPGFVVNHSATMFASCIGVVLVSVIPGLGWVRHDDSLSVAPGSSTYSGRLQQHRDHKNTMEQSLPKEV